MLEGITRESIGSASAKKLRRDGYLTANIYANGVENVQAAFKRGDFLKAVRAKGGLTLSFTVAGTEFKTVIQEYQLHPVNGDVKHVDLRVAVPGQVTNFLVPVETTGLAKGIKNKGVLMLQKKRLKVRGAIENIPNLFTLDVSDLDRDESILIRDMEVPAECRLMDRPDVAVVGVIKAK
ncbi:MAG: LSU ribosomal protein L25p [uncultured Sulfurovum sp.]|uniref:50S ribosomal protein L25 n=1 Tax=uncultured Sulfurovum sp. TaxID=269237 RepID=A0A6S6TEP1_9BACT|nr:MAG: LSU ribosomal protein L25p [uncultured Sulfurovum sp.]